MSQLIEPVARLIESFSRLPGVGPKTAAIILLVAFNRPAFPVDTHVHRLSKRIGFIGEKVNAEKAHGRKWTFYLALPQGKPYDVATVEQRVSECAP